MDRECDKCVYHTSGSCSRWYCEYKTVEQIKTESFIQGADNVTQFIFSKCYSNPVNCMDIDCPFNGKNCKIYEYVKGLKHE